MDDQRAPTANGVACIDCGGFGNYYRDHLECPMDLEHVTEPVFISDSPLGWEHDEDYKVGRKQLWVYPAEES